jgi:hypothetical protein
LPTLVLAAAGAAPLAADLVLVLAAAGAAPLAAD